MAFVDQQDRGHVPQNDRGRGATAYQVKERKLRAILGLAAGTSELDKVRLEHAEHQGQAVDLRPWVRYALPEFVVIVSDDHGRIVGVIDTDTTEFHKIDAERCHPSDASLLLSGETYIRIASLIEAIEQIVKRSVEGDRRTSALALTHKLQRVISSGT